MTTFNARQFFVAACALASLTVGDDAFARPHNGLGEFIGLQKELFSSATDEYWASMPESRFANTSTMPFSAMATLPALTSVSEVSGVLRQLAQPHFVTEPEGVQREIDAYYGPRTNSRDGHHPIMRGEWESYAFGTWNTGDYDNGRNRPIYNPETFGGVVGAQRWFDDERLVGVTGSFNHTRAKMHNGGGSIDGENLRLRAYAALVPEGQPWWLALGASGGWLNYRTKRALASLPATPDADVPAKGTPEGYEVGLFAALNARLHITDDLVFTPFARVDYDNTSISRFTEHTAEAETGFPLRVQRFNADSLQTRIGAGLEYTFRHTDFIVNASCTVAWASELAGDDIKVAAALNDYPDVRYKTFGSQLFGDAVEISPTISVVLKNGIVLQAAYTLHITFDAQFAQGFSGSFGWRF